MPPSSLLPLAAALAVATGLSAQVTPRTFSAGISVQAGPVTSAVLPGNEISTGAQLVAGSAGGDAAFDYSPGWDLTAVDLVFDLTCNAFVQTGATGGGSTRHELWSARPVNGRFVITWTAALGGTGQASFGFDLFDDGTVDATASAVLAGTLPAGVTVFRVDTSASASAGVIPGPFGGQIPFQGTAQARLRIRFEPLHCTSLPYAPACVGPVTAVAGNFLGGVTLRSQCAPADDLAIAVFGSSQSSVTLPLAPGCVLRTSPLASLWRVIGAGGDVEWSTSLPAGFGPVTFHAQVVALDVDLPSATTSQAFVISCP